MYDLLKVSKNKIKVYGVDISSYAKSKAMPLIRKKIKICNCKKLPFKDNFFDFVISINTVHNLEKADCINAIKEISRVSKGKAFIQLNSYLDKKKFKKFFKLNVNRENFFYT